MSGRGTTCSAALGIKHIGHPIRRDHHGVVTGPDLDHLPAGRLHPVAAPPRDLNAPKAEVPSQKKKIKNQRQSGRKIPYAGGHKP